MFSGNRTISTIRTVGAHCEGRRAGGWKVRLGGNLEREPGGRNHRSAAKQATAEVWEDAVVDIRAKKTNALVVRLTRTW